ncbi:hypothetical protein FB451DRAFT_374661 [Mycena latifolia]|nr:hypothetical protein FB451DRAFT_374661 [Mycena latifolia]
MGVHRFSCRRFWKGFFGFRDKIQSLPWRTAHKTIVSSMLDATDSDNSRWDDKLRPTQFRAFNCALTHRTLPNAHEGFAAANVPHARIRDPLCVGRCPSNCCIWFRPWGWCFSQRILVAALMADRRTLGLVHARSEWSTRFTSALQGLLL